MLVLALAIVGHLVGLPPPPPVPSGTWSCALEGRSVGTLTVEGMRYVFAGEAAGATGSGSLAMSRVRLGATARAGLVRIWNGPLTEAFGITLGFHNRAATPETLVFNMGPERGLACVRS